MVNLQSVFKPFGAAFGVPKSPQQRHKRGEVWFTHDNGEVLSGTFSVYRGLLTVKTEGICAVAPLSDQDPLVVAERLMAGLVKRLERGGHFMISPADLDAALHAVVKRDLS